MEGPLGYPEINTMELPVTLTAQKKLWRSPPERGAVLPLQRTQVPGEETLAQRRGRAAQGNGCLRLTLGTSLVLCVSCLAGPWPRFSQDLMA